MKRRPDKFERMIAKLVFSDNLVMGEEAANALRQYHEAVVETVKQMQACIDSPYGHGRYDMQQDILTRLKELAK